MSRLLITLTNVECLGHYNNPRHQNKEHGEKLKAIAVAIESLRTSYVHTKR